MRSHLPGLALCGLAALAAPACKSPEQHRLEADREAYDIVQQRREELGAFDPFTVDPETDTLRRRLIEGQQVEPVDLAEALVIAAENSRTYRTRRESLFLEALDLTLQHWNFSVQPNAGGVVGLDGEGDDVRRQEAEAGIGFTKLFTSGLAVVGDLALNSVRLIGSGDGSSSWEDLSRASLLITQPLLRGFGSDIVREPLTQAERNVLYEARTYERFRRTFAFDVTSSFFGVLEQQATIVNEEENYRGLTNLRERNESFAEAGRLNEIEVDQARQNELSARNRVILARIALQTRQDDFKLLLGLPIEASLPLDAAQYLDLATWDFLELDLSEDQVIDTALSKRLDYMTQLEVIEDETRRMKIAEDALRNGLDFVFSADHETERREAGDWSSSNVNWSVDLSLDLAINRLPERNAYRESIIRVEQAKRAAEQLGDTIVADLRQALRDLVAARETYEIQELAVELALRRVESTELSLEAGRSSTRDVLESQESLINAQNALVRATTSYVLSALALYRDMELLTVTEEGVDVDVTPFQPDQPDQPEDQP